VVLGMVSLPFHSSTLPRVLFVSLVVASMVSLGEPWEACAGDGPGTRRSPQRFPSPQTSPSLRRERCVGKRNKWATWKIPITPARSKPWTTHVFASVNHAMASWENWAGWIEVWGWVCWGWVYLCCFLVCMVGLGLGLIL